MNKFEHIRGGSLNSEVHVELVEHVLVRGGLSPCTVRSKLSRSEHAQGDQGTTQSNAEARPLCVCGGGPVW